MSHKDRVWLRVVRDSSDLGLDRGMRAYVADYHSNAKMDIVVPSLDMMIAGVAIDHPDLVIAKSPKS